MFPKGFVSIGLKMKIKKAHISDSKQLTELTIRSKSYWKYSKLQIEKWRDDLSVSKNYILEKKVYKLTDNEKLIGYYSYFKLNEEDVKLENLFIEPDFIGKGYGKMLMLDMLQRIEKTEIKRVILDADPNSRVFYEHIGFKVIGKRKSSIKDRFLPIMEIKIRPAYNRDE